MEWYIIGSNKPRKEKHFLTLSEADSLFQEPAEEKQKPAANNHSKNHNVQSQEYDTQKEPTIITTAQHGQVPLHLARKTNPGLE